MNEAIKKIEREMDAITIERMLMRIGGGEVIPEIDDALAKREWKLWAERNKLVDEDIRLIFSDDCKAINDRGFAFPVFIRPPND